MATRVKNGGRTARSAVAPRMRQSTPTAEGASVVARTKALLEETLREAVEAGATDVPRVPPDFTSAMYDAITKMFASRNPTQLFCLTWPGAVMDYERLMWTDEEEIGGNMPEDSLIRSSIILDQYIPAAPITQPDGTRVSDRYSQALSHLGPRPDANLIQLQDIIRARLKVEVTREIDGKERTFTLAAWFDYLHSQWAEAKRAWGEKQLDMQEKFKQKYADNPNRDAWWNAYLQWYGDNADAFVSRINGKWEQLIAEFPLTEWEDAIAVLDTRDDVGLAEARQILANATRPLPYQEGVDFVPTQGIPYDWPLLLRPSTKFLDLLADPESQQMAYDTALAELEQEIFNWTAIVPQIDSEQIKRDAEALAAATTGYSTAQSELINQYGKNTVDAVKMFCDIKKSRGQKVNDVKDGSPEADQITKDVNKTSADISKGQGQSPAKDVDWDEIKKIADKIGEGQSTLIQKQQGLIDAGLTLVAAADEFLRDKWNQSSYPWLGGYVQQLKSKLSKLEKQWENFASASNVWFKYRSTAKAGDDPNEDASFGADSFPSALDSPANDRWTLVKATVNATQLDSSTTMSTSFSASQWGVDLFFFSAGGSSQTQRSSIASEFMKSGSEIQIGFLATKVLINRPWMKPEVFAQTRNLFRTVKKPLAPKYQVQSEEFMGPDASDFIQQLMNDYTFPCYPVALLLVKDVTVRVQIQMDKTSDMRDYSKSVSSQGGGFLCFSVSSSSSSESQSESTNSYCMAGQFVARAPAPQVIGYWVQFLPPDESQELTPDIASEIAQALGFATKLKAAHAANDVPALGRV